MTGKEASRSFRMAAWLGWQIESNWADPFLFAIYSVIKPVAGVMILVVMYNVVTQGNTRSPVFAYIYLGNAFYIYVISVTTGVSWAVIEDREHYQTLKYVYISPLRIPFYLLGRGMARFFTGSISVLITLLVGVLFMGLRLPLREINWPLLAVALPLGILALGLMGLMLAGVTLLTARHVYFIGEATAGALYLFCGAIFPLEVLPAALRPLGFVLPVTYWLELIRRALLGATASAFPTLAGFGDGQLLAILAALTLLFGVIAVLAFRYCDLQARERGLIDMTTHY